jgi:hypothetical protein
MSEPRFEDAILAEVARKPTVKEFGVSGPFGMHVNGPSADNKFEYPVSRSVYLSYSDRSANTDS